MVNPVFITAQHGFIINRHNMEGVISTQDLGYHPYYKKLVNQQCDSMSHVCYILYLIILKCSHGYKPGLYVGHYDPSGGKPPGQFFLCRHRDCIMYYDIETNIEIIMADHIKYLPLHDGSRSKYFCYPITRRVTAQNMELS